MNDKKLKILFISSWYPNKYQPLLGIFVKRQAVAVAQLCEVSVLFICSGERAEMVESSEEGVYAVRGYFKKVNHGIPLIAQLQRLSRYLSAWRKVVKLYESKRGKPDLIQANIVLPVSLIAKKLKRKWKIPYIISEHWSGYFPEDGRYKGFVMQMLTKWAVRNASAIVTVSEALKKNMLNAGLANNYYVISNMVDTQTFNIPVTPVNKEGIFTFIHVSSLDEMEKNVTGIIHSFSNLHKLIPDIKLILVGDGENKNTLQKLIEKLGIIDAVSFTGAIPGREVAVLIQNSDVFVLFSNFETQSVVLLEALCCGIPVISSRCGGPEEYITPKNGLLVDTGNENQLTGAMELMVKNRTMYNAAEIRNSVADKVNSSAVLKQFLAIYKIVLSQHSTS